ncbi:class I SAM-dependent methyltransferase [Methanofollis ethanolicus]|uniref:class I SAM-dependent methyltransferase n=1 Tax=Methanofollis ethanolicus TaxID=488124 RepID=UPI00082D73C5|nr:methyltransferase domain-containing protein [Methanofollis ethanolicus]
MKEKRREDMSDCAFRIMKFSFFNIRDPLCPPVRLLEKFEIEPGMTVVDYGCGPGSYAKAASQLVGKKGHVYAVDIHPLAIESVSALIKEGGLTNVSAILSERYDSNLDDHIADLVYALDMIHMIRDADTFFRELKRIAKPGGILIINDGRQSREETLEDIRQSGIWSVEEENRDFLRCRPADGS